MSPAEWVAKQSAQVGWLKQCRVESTDPTASALIDAEIDKATRKLDDFIDFANGIYWPREELP